MDAQVAAVVIAAIALIQAVSVALINSKMKEREEKREEREKERDERDKTRERRDTHIYDLMFATANGTEVLLQEAHGDKLNGNVEAALNSIQKAKSACNHTFNEHVAKL